MKDIAKKGQVTSIQALIKKSAKELGKALPTHMRPERLVRIALTCIRRNPKLAKCDPTSFLGSLFVSAQCGIEPMGGRAYILPYWNNRKKVYEAQFIMGYKGLAELFYRHEKAVMLNWGVVHEEDTFEYEYGTNAHLMHKPALSDRGKTIGYYVIAELKGGAKPFHYMSKRECFDHGKKHSKTYNKKQGGFSKYSPWATDFDVMALKTVLIQLSKVLPLSIEMQRVIQADETIRDFQPVDNALDIPVETIEPEEPEEPQEKKDPGAITEKQRKRMFAIMKKHKVSHEDLKKYISDQYFYDSTKDIKWTEYEDICNWIEKS